MRGEAEERLSGSGSVAGKDQINIGYDADGIVSSRSLMRFWQREDDDTPAYIADGSGRLIAANAGYRRVEAALAAVGFVAGGPVIVAAIQALGRGLLQDHVIEIGGARECYTSHRRVIKDGGGEVIAVVGRLETVDELRRAEKSMLLYRERVEDLERLVSDWIWETDTDLRLMHVSPRVIDRLGFHQRELLGTRFDELAGGGEARLRSLHGATAREPFDGLRVKIQHKNGDVRSFLLHGVPMFAADTGRFLGYRGTAEDVTDREAATAALMKAVDDAQAASRSKSQFLAHMSHELRTPLNAIIGFSEVMSLETMGEMGNPKYKEYAQDILASSRHLLDLINDVLDLAKIEAGKMMIEEEHVPIARLFQNVERVIADRASRARLRFSIDSSGDLPAIRGDERRLLQILLNLLSNAIKFTPAGGTVEVKAIRHEAGDLTIAVVDTGIGIPQEKINLALEPFGQVESGMSRRFDGTGLGLPLAKVLTELHDGRLSIASKPGFGTTVALRLPASRLVAAGPRSYRPD